MEVQHQAQHEGKKNWKSYVWEFLMLFLAVFCSFLAEMQLEQNSENNMEKEYIGSMVEDINADIEQIDRLTKDLDIRVSRTDSLLTELSSKEIYKNANKAYKLWLSTQGFQDFIQNDRTIQQLKNSGGLRTIHKKLVSDKIMEYDQMVRMLGVSQEIGNTYAANSLSLFTRTFDFIQLDDANALSKPIPLTSKGKELLNETYGNRFFWKMALMRLKNRMKGLSEKGQEVVGVIKKEYRIK
jgi:hypothetical protein